MALRHDPHQLKRLDRLNCLMDLCGIERLPWRPGEPMPDEAPLGWTVRGGIFSATQDVELSGPEYRQLDRHLIAWTRFCAFEPPAVLASAEMLRMVGELKTRFLDLAAGRESTWFRRPPAPPFDFAVATPIRIGPYPAQALVHYHQSLLRWVLMFHAYLPEDLEHEIP